MLGLQPRALVAQVLTRLLLIWRAAWEAFPVTFLVKSGLLAAACMAEHAVS